MLGVYTDHVAEHLNSMISNAGDKAKSYYARLLKAIRREGTTNGRLHKSADGVKSTSEPTYLCLQCSNVSSLNERHRKDHAFGEI